MIYNLFELRSIKREQSADGKEEEKKGFGISKPEIPGRKIREFPAPKIWLRT
jgi:hypothetical protein